MKHDHLTAAKKKQTREHKKVSGKLGVWLIGAYGGLATTLITGVRLIVGGWRSTSGLITATPGFSAIATRDLGDLVFGGCDVRRTKLYDSAYAIHQENGTIPLEGLQAIRSDLDRIDRDISAGTIVNCGDAIANLAGKSPRSERRTLARIVEDLRSDIAGFKERNRLDEVVVVNLASTEPPLEIDEAHATAAGVRHLISSNARQKIRASTLYAWAALEADCALINFTPSNAFILPGHVEFAIQRGLPLMGNDGKTGETLMKSALAPMFKYRNLKVLTWQGYNILGDRDGQILADARNKKSKINTKDGVLSSILGYPLHTHVAIDYVPSLADMKTAWDFVHFQGFLDFKMSLQFIWQGCDAILAAPLVVDMVRLADHARRNGEKGLMTQLACFFKRPLGVEEQDLHWQFHHLVDYVERTTGRRRSKRR